MEEKKKRKLIDSAVLKLSFKNFWRYRSRPKKAQYYRTKVNIIASVGLSNHATKTCLGSRALGQSSKPIYNHFFLPFNTSPTSSSKKKKKKFFFSILKHPQQWFIKKKKKKKLENSTFFQAKKIFFFVLLVQINEIKCYCLCSEKDYWRFFFIYSRI